MAWARVCAEGLVQTRESGYMGSSDVRLTLGLGDRTQVDTLQVHWPSGAVQTLMGVEADQRIVIREDR